MVKMGFLISLSGLIALGASFLIKIVISKTGGVEQVGYYNAGFAIINTYVGMIFTAMSIDFYPKLSSLAYSNIECRELINHQAEIAILILAPIIMVFLVYINWVVIILYSSKFISINNMILYAALGMLFKAASWPIGFILLAKGNSKIFFWSELSASAYMLVLSILGYKFFGLDGLGFSFLLGYVLYLFQAYFIARLNYEFSFSRSFYQIFVLQLALSIICLLLIKLIEKPFSYIFGSSLILISIFFAYRELDRRIGIKSLIVSIIRRQ